MDQTIRLDAKKRESSFCEEKIYPLRRGERNNVVLTVQVRADGAPYDLTGKEARLVGTTADGKLVGPCPLEISDAKAGTGSLTLPASMCSAVGTTHSYIEVREGETLVETTDSFACKVLECADMDAEQAEEAAPIIVELRDAVESAKRAAEGADAAASHQPRIGGAGTWETWDAAAGAYADTGVPAQGQQGSQGIQGIQGPQGDPFTYDDFTESQIAELKRPATEAATLAKNAIAEVKATEAKLYPAAENILVGSETGTVAHVEDAFDGASLREITVEGACKQDGTPSPDNPVPIQVVENPVLWVAGTNLLNPTQLESTGYFYNAVNGELQVNANDGRAWTIVAQYGVLPAGTYYVGGDSFEIRRAADNASLVYTEGTTGGFKLDTATSVKIKIGFGHKDSQYPYVSHAMMCVSSGNYPAYAPYVGTSTPFTLPAEHPYLAKLPDGTADEIVVDRDGNVELVARVGMNEQRTAVAPIPETRYPLGKIEMPKAQDSIVNAWTDAEVTPNTGIEYVRDVNIAFANIEDAIASITQG